MILFMRKFFEKYPEYSYDPSTGEIFGKDGRVLKPGTNHGGYLHVMLYENGEKKNYYVHRLIAEAEIPNPEGKSQINHKNEIKTDNRACNLEWVTAKENNNYGTRKAQTSERLKGNKNGLGNKSNLGRNFSEEHRKKISEANKKYWANKKMQRSD